MLIGIDGNEANIEERVGVNVYAFELIKNIAKLEKEWKDKFRIVVYLKRPPLADFPPETENFKYKIIPGQGFWIVRNLLPSLILDSPRPNLWFSPSHYIPPFSPIPTVCSIMDLGFLEFPNQFRWKDYWQLKIWTWYSVVAAKKVIAISESTKSDIIRYYAKENSKVCVTYLGFDKEKFNQAVSISAINKVKQEYSLAKDYLLFLGTIRPSKNIEGLIAAWAKIESHFLDVSLVIAGKKGWLFDPIFEKVKSQGLEKRVLFTGFIAEEEKPALIKGAKAFILPSFWEGFGLDVVSAMAVGTPVIVANKGSLPEITQGAGLLVNPGNKDDIALAISKLLSLNQNEYNKLSRKGLGQANKFSWQKTARLTVEALAA